VSRAGNSLARSGGLLSIALVGCAPVIGGELVEAPTASFGPMTVRSPSALEILGPTGPTEVGRVVDITDGDTVRVIIDGEEHRLRYIGIDTPETTAPDTPVEAYGPEATTANALLVGGEDVVLEIDVSDTDRYDRLLRYVWLAPGTGDTPTDTWTLVNLELVRVGLAEAVDYPPDTKYSAELDAAEDGAREQGLGIWTSE
jgi:endonuclease YncB( thermonuclease family)